MMVGILIGVIGLAIILFRGMRVIFNKPILWFFISISVYIVCMGGLVYNLLNGTPFYRYHKDGSYDWKTRDRS